MCIWGCISYNYTYHCNAVFFQTLQYIYKRFPNICKPFKIAQSQHSSEVLPPSVLGGYGESMSGTPGAHIFELPKKTLTFQTLLFNRDPIMVHYSRFPRYLGSIIPFIQSTTTVFSLLISMQGSHLKRLLKNARC